MLLKEMSFAQEDIGVEWAKRRLVLEVEASTARLWVAVVAVLCRCRRQPTLSLEGLYKRGLGGVQVVKPLDLVLHVSAFQSEAV